MLPLGESFGEASAFETGDMPRIHCSAVANELHLSLQSSISTVRQLTNQRSLKRVQLTSLPAQECDLRSGSIGG